MKRRKLGPGGPRPTEIGAVGLGCMGMSEFYGPADETTSIATIHHALDAGMSFLDTADMYGSGHNERLVGQALKGRRDQAVLATKFAILRGEGGTFVGVSGKPEYVKKACDASLERLGVAHIDLYYQHRVDPQVPIEDTVGAMAELVQAGKVRHLGLSECSAETLRRAHKVHPISAVQSEYSLWSRDPERGVLDACRELGISFVAYSPLGRGFLTGALPKPDELAQNDYRRFMPRTQGDNLGQNQKIVDKLKAITAAKGVTPAQLALAWVLSRGEHVVTIPGTRSTKRVDENAAAADVTLTAQELKQIDEAFPPGVAAGERYPESGMQMVNR
jgi:aryl-alcohol dehydrogenase-like predicted oxidoreductase